ncbi:MAG: DUF2726 domain-containing protein [Nitrospira sp.]|nr:DUF2726 domain-containing protein [Nitrospira sp.]
MKDLVIGGAAVAVAVVWWLVVRSKASGGSAAGFTLPAEAVVTAQPLLTNEESSFYNRLRIAIQDRYLILAHVPLRVFVSVDVSGKNRSRILKQLVLTRVDFALVHPGSRHVEHVVLLDGEPPNTAQHDRHHVVESVMAAAGIKVTKARSTRSYTIPELLDLLGLSDEEPAS